MEKPCELCDFLRNTNPKTQIVTTKNWSVGLGNNFAYFGRAYMTLREHKASLGALGEEEWIEFEDLVRRLEQAYKNLFGAEPLNIGCYMNHAFRTEPYNPHVHWHIYPRYKVAPVYDSVAYPDPLFGSFYDNEAETTVSDEVVQGVAAKLSAYLASPEGQQQNLPSSQPKSETWLIASNPAKYDIVGAFAAHNTITWGLTVKVNVGDVVYIYLSAPYSRIAYKCTVDRTDVPITERLGAEFWLEKFNPTRNLVNLRRLSAFDDERLRLQNLIDSELMLSAPQGPRRVPNELNRFLNTL